MWSFVAETTLDPIIFSDEVGEVNRRADTVKRVFAYYDGNLRLIVNLGINCKLVLFRSTLMKVVIGVGTCEKNVQSITYTVGWTTNIGEKAVVELHESGLIVMKNEDGRQ